MAGNSAQTASGETAGRVVLGDNETVLVSGHFDYDSVVQARDEGEKLIRALSAPHCTVDLSGVQSGDSVFMALLLSWMRLCESRGIALKLVAVPGPLMAMARVSGLDTFLPVDSEANEPHS